MAGPIGLISWQHSHWDSRTRTIHVPVRSGADSSCWMWGRPGCAMSHVTLHAGAFHDENHRAYLPGSLATFPLGPDNLNGLSFGASGP
jgi:hypothetical protein